MKRHEGTKVRSPEGSLGLRVAVTTVSVAALFACVVTLGGLEIDRGPHSGPANLASLRPFWIASALAWAALSATAVLLRGATAGTGRRFAAVTATVLGVAIAARAAVVATHDVGLSDDLYRYVLDGRHTAEGGNPYLRTPEAVLEEDEAWTGQHAIARRVNNAELHTIYLPMSQWCFAAAGTIARGQADPDAAASTFRGVFIAIEVIAMILLSFALWKRGRSAWWLALYAWHPLPLSEIAGSGHQDVIGIALLAAAVALFAWSARRWAPWIAALALAAAVKPIVVPVAAVLLKGRPVRAWIGSALLGAAITAAVSAPLLLTADGAPFEHLRATASRFSLKWAHFGSVYEPVLWTIEQAAPTWSNDPQEQLARIICLGLLAAVVGLVLWRGRDPWGSCAGIFLAMVLLTPAAHPWYLLWALLLAPLRFLAPIWIASVTLPWGYAVLGDTAAWTVSPWITLAAYAPVYGALIVGAARTRRPS